MFAIRIFWLVAILLSVDTASAREVTVAFGQHKPPYVFLDGKRGIEIDLFREALALNGDTLRIKIMPKRRLKFSLRKYSDFDAVSSVNLSKDRFFYSDRFINFRDVVVTRNSEGIQLDHIKDLAPYKVGAWQGASVTLGKEIGRLYGKGGTHRRDYREYPSQLNQNIAFWSGKIDVMIIDQHIFSYYRRMLANDFETEQHVTFHKLFPQETPHYVAFKEKVLRDQFNDALAILKYNGRYRKVIERYIP